MLSEIGALIKCVAPSTCMNEFTIHVPKEYDYCLITDKRDEII